MKISDMYQSVYISPDELQPGVRVRRTIAIVELVTVHPQPGKEETRLCLYFNARSEDKKRRGILLSKTNAQYLSDHLNDETDDWIGKDIIIFNAPIKVMGEEKLTWKFEIPKPEGEK